MKQTLTKRTLDLCGSHLQSYLKAKEAVSGLEKLPSENLSDESDLLWKAYSEGSMPHPAVQSAATEVNYTRSMVDLLLHVLVPPPHLESRTGRLIVGELITCNVLFPLITKLSDPDWLNILLIAVFTSSKSNEQPELAGTQQSISSPSVPVNCPGTLYGPQGHGHTNALIPNLPS